MLMEPLAVNAFETVHGVMHMKANAMRSYDITAEIVCGNQILEADGGIFDSRTSSDSFKRRTGKWALHEQTYYFDSYVSGDETVFPESNGLYQADGIDGSMDFFNE